MAEERASVLARVSADLSYLASEELEGRGPGTAGRQKAAEHIRDEFQRMGLTSGVADGSYLQPFQMPLDMEVVADQTRLVFRGPDDQALPLELATGFQPLAVGGAGEGKGEVVFAGYGISAPDWNYDDYAGLDVEGKIVLVIRREPQQDDEQSVFDGKKTTMHSYIRTKLQLAKKQKAAGVLLVNDPFSVKQGEADQLTAPSGFGTNSVGIPFAQVTQATVNTLLGHSPLRTSDGRLLSGLDEVEAEIDRTGQPLSQSLDGWSADVKYDFRKTQVDLANVIGVLEGDGPLAAETIVIGAHYDHLGFGEYGSRRPGERAVHYGADDNASGTAAIIELARRYASRPNRPARRLVFIAFDAEERGLIGSRHYLDHPSFPLEDTVAMVNCDMVGRLRDAELTVMGSGTAVEFDRLLDQAAETSGLTLKKSPRVTAQSDHYPFFEREVPCPASVHRNSSGLPHARRHVRQDQHGRRVADDRFLRAVSGCGAGAARTPAPGQDRAEESAGPRRGVFGNNSGLFQCCRRAADRLGRVGFARGKRRLAGWRRDHPLRREPRDGSAGAHDRIAGKQTGRYREHHCTTRWPDSIMRGHAECFALGCGQRRQVP
jgi:hypothetical protein